MNKLLLALLMVLISQKLMAESRLTLGEFSLNRLDGWQQKSFVGHTLYRLENLEGLCVLKAESNASASGLFKEQRIDLQQTPYLNWSWRIVNRLDGLNEQSKAGDDYPARIYVLIQGGLAFWQTRAISYVWASTSTKDRIWPNAFAGEHAMMMALRGPEAGLNVWYHEKRNVRIDLQTLFGEEVRYIDAVALMTDTDNSRGRVVGFYGDIWFSRD